MKKLFLSTIVLLNTQTMAHASPGSFNRALALYESGERPNLEMINQVKLKGGCFTELAEVEFPQNFEVTFRKISSSKQYNAEYFDTLKDITTTFENLVINETNVETQPQRLSDEAFFKMSYRTNGTYLIEAITLHDKKADESMVLNMCYYNL